MSYLEIIAVAFIAWMILVTLFTPAIPYHSEEPTNADTDHFIHVLESTCQTTVEHGNKIDVFTDGIAFYPAMLDAIARARETINMECYIVRKGEIADRIIAALIARARAGVKVSLLMDAVGSFG